MSQEHDTATKKTISNYPEPIWDTGFNLHGSAVSKES